MFVWTVVLLLGRRADYTTARFCHSQEMSQVCHNVIPLLIVRDNPYRYLNLVTPPPPPDNDGLLHDIARTGKTSGEKQHFTKQSLTLFLYFRIVAFVTRCSEQFKVPTAIAVSS